MFRSFFLPFLLLVFGARWTTSSTGNGMMNSIVCTEIAVPAATTVAADATAAAAAVAVTMDALTTFPVCATLYYVMSPTTTDINQACRYQYDILQPSIAGTLLSDSELADVQTGMSVEIAMDNTVMDSCTVSITTPDGTKMECNSCVRCNGDDEAAADSAAADDVDDEEAAFTVDCSNIPVVGRTTVCESAAPGMIFFPLNQLALQGGFGGSSGGSGGSSPKGRGAGSSPPEDSLPEPDDITVVPMPLATPMAIPTMLPEAAAVTEPPTRKKRKPRAPGTRPVSVPAPKVDCPPESENNGTISPSLSPVFMTEVSRPSAAPLLVALQPPVRFIPSPRMNAPVSTSEESISTPTPTSTAMTAPTGMRRRRRRRRPVAPTRPSPSPIRFVPPSTEEQGCTDCEPATPSPSVVLPPPPPTPFPILFIMSSFGPVPAPPPLSFGEVPPEENAISTCPPTALPAETSVTLTPTTVPLSNTAVGDDCPGCSPMMVPTMAPECPPMAMTIVRTWTVSSQTTSVSTSTETTNEGGGVRSLKSAVAHSNDINGSGAIDAESGGIMAHTEASQQLRGHAV